MKPKYPIYVISKGRSDCCKTSYALEEMGVDHKVVVEPTEVDAYKETVDPAKLVVLPFHDLGQGSIPARNFVWEHALTTGSKRHWIMDDNIRYFGRLNVNQKVQVTSGTIIRLMEKFTDRYKNVAISGPNYDYFCVQTCKAYPYTMNTRVYSCILIQNDLPHRWRGRYNEDTDLCLRVLKDDHCTLLFNAFLQFKTPTLTMRGGNTEHVYIDGDNRYKFAESLRDQHPDCVKIVKKFGRWHHEVDYREFKVKNDLIFRDDYVQKKGINNYGLKLIDTRTYEEKLLYGCRHVQTPNSIEYSWCKETQGYYKCLGCEHNISLKPQEYGS